MDLEPFAAPPLTKKTKIWTRDKPMPARKKDDVSHSVLLPPL
jgi:hypothetical protein